MESLDPRILAALDPPTPGRVVRLLGPVFKGVGRTEQQIREFAAHWRAEVEPALDADRPLVVALGDSLAQGIGANAPSQSYVGVLANELGARVVNLSRSGARSRDVITVQLPALDAVLQRAKQPPLVVCSVGSNDLVRSARIGQVRSNITTLIESLPDEAIIATLPSIGSVNAKLLNRHIRSEAGRRGLRVADVGKQLSSWRGRQAKDRFHPNSAGYQVWADAFLARSLCPTGEQP